ncbi:hypothetical protein [uncultured Sunxiuqinia sp.]|uniref:hypothetical protein n=1 Tax=uncultured Sunxiuqinia sp. TaxID=1573825 RepID=UPI0034337DF5
MLPVVPGRHGSSGRGFRLPVSKHQQKLLSVENGDILDMAPHKIPQRKAFIGKCLLLLRSTDTPGDITISAYAKGLNSATLMLRSH